LATDRPGLLLVVTDHSGSMDQEFSQVTDANGQQKTVKLSHAVSDVVDSTLAAFVRRHRDAAGKVRDRLDVALVGYGHTVGSNFEGGLTGRDVVTLSELARSPVSVDQSSGVPQPRFLSPRAHGGTPMNRGFSHAEKVLDGWYQSAPQGGPARGNGEHLVLGVHITDGAPDHGAEPSAQVAALAQKVQSHGGTLVMTNIHISPGGGSQQAVRFPTPAEAAQLPREGQMLFELSSPVPDALVERLGTRPGARMMVYNGSADDLAQVFAAGSSVAAQ
jgi:hypothetical protein